MNEVRIGIGVGSVAGNPARYAYDRFGNLAAVTNALGNAIVYEYDLRGRKTYEGGATYPVRYTYDVFGNKVAMTTYRAEGAQEGDVTQWLYDEASNCMTNKVYADGNGTKYEYDAHGRLAKRTWARGIDTTYTYNACDRRGTDPGEYVAVNMSCCRAFKVRQVGASKVRQL